MDGLDSNAFTIHVGQYFTFQEKNMKKLQPIFASVTLTLLMSVSTSAGIMETGVAQPPPPPATATVATQQNTEAEAEGVMTTGVPSSEAVKEMALSVLQSVLALF
jgi:hypothetical protein